MRREKTCSVHYFCPLLQIRWICVSDENNLGQNRLFIWICKCSHLHKCYYYLILFCICLASFSSLIRRIIIHIIFTSSKEEEVQWRKKLKTRWPILFWVTCILFLLMNFSKYTPGWIGMSWGTQTHKYKCHFHLGSGEIHILDQHSAWS